MVGTYATTQYTNLINEINFLIIIQFWKLAGKKIFTSPEHSQEKKRDLEGD